MENKKIPLFADEIITGLGLGKRKLRKNNEIIIRILSAEMMTRKELAKRLRNEPAYDCQKATDEQLGDRVEHLVRYFGILGCQDVRYFVINSKADPKFQDNDAKNFTGEFIAGRAVRSIIYEILGKNPLPAGQLTKKVENHPEYDGSKGLGKKLKAVVNHILNNFRNKKSFFERDKSRGKYNVWRIKENSKSPPWKAGGYQERPRLKRDAIHQLMRAKAVINGWSSRDLFWATRQSALRYKSPKIARKSLNRLFHRNKAYFEQIPGTKPVHWRARWLGPLKTPSCPREFFDLASQVLDDLMAPRSLEDLLKVIRQSGHLFGYQTNELPLTFLQNQIVKVIAGTKYASLIL